MGKVEKGVDCSVTGCGEKAVRSLSRAEVSGSGLSAGGDGRRAYLCRNHYKIWKKATKKSRALDRSRW